MSSDALYAVRRFGRRTLPWVAWGVAAAAALILNLTGRGLGHAPAAAELRAVSLSSPLSLRVVSVEVKEGEAVAAGQVVARLDSTKADAELTKARAGLERLKLEVIAKEAALGQLSERFALELAQLEADEKRDRAQLTQLDAQVERQKGLVAEKLASADHLDELSLKRAAVADRLAAYAPALQRIRQGRAAARPGVSGAQDARLERQLAPLRAAVTAQEAECQKLERLRASLDLTAPFAGRVSQVHLRPMETARVGRPVVTLVDEEPRTAVAYVDQSWAGEVKVGDEVTLAPVDHSGPTRKGKVTALGPAIAETPKRFQLVPTKPAYSREARIELGPGSTSMLPGQAFTAAFQRGQGAAPANLLGAR